MGVDINWGALETVNPMARLAEGERYAERKRDDAMRHQQAQTRQQALQQYSVGDASGAKRTALSSGDLETYSALSQLDGEQKKAARDRAEQLAILAYGVKRTPYEQRRAVLGSMTPQLSDFGFKPEQLAAFDPTDEALDAVISQGLSLKDMIDRDAKENEPYTLGRGDVRFKGEKEVARGLPPEEQYLIVPEGGKAIPKSSMGGGGYGATAPATSAAPSTPGPGGGSGAPRNQRNNNPGNIEDGDFARSLPGYTGTDGRFATFDSPDAGRAAQGRLLASYGARGFDTVAKIINRWAPPSDDNPTEAYVRFVAQKVGVDPNTPLDLQNPQVQQVVAAAIEQFEGGGQSASNDGALMGQAGQDSLQPRAGDPPGTVYGNPKRRGRELTPQESAAYGPGRWWLDENGKPSQIGGTAPGDKDADGYTARQRNEATVNVKTKFEALPQVKAFRDVQSSYSIIRSLAQKKDPTAADDISLIFSYMKMLDPGSVVREGEFANAQNSGGVPDQVVNAYNKALSGNRLNARQRQAFASTAGQIVVDRRNQFDAAAGEYRTLAKDFGGDPDRIAPAPGKWKEKASKRTAPTGPPKVGAIVKGYRFKGGDPANPASWAKVQ